MTEWSGILPLFKPAGMTSHDCVMKIRRLAQTKKVGHTGTLDPDVTGVLPICIGQATKVADYLHDEPKRYRAQVTFGVSTDTEDASGTPVEKAAIHGKLNEQQVRDVFKQFTGEILQVPPMYSAVRVNGKRLHELAREGKVVERKPRSAIIYSMQIEEMNLDQLRPTVRFTVDCSKGTYIRTLCVDIGKALGVPAHMSYLQRIKSGPFTLDQCYFFDEVERACADHALDKLLFPLDQALLQYPHVEVPAGRVQAIRNGLSQRHLRPGHWNIGDKIRIYAPDGTFLALHEVIETDRDMGVESKPVKVF
ncbi:tRNA pseudouridine(55) synthase TruB [Aneurinibacillus sp. Ricciae_BoGa-3]|uniref:tRNA pseudouridine(55) synthase TruB n=1 Tax=Aneurinibacillus sp. Ricciae_BoGa-3 TaxID=3022697 RepID=UPI0023418A65|nr:tRNA pseudouridine(55) synthase TruB [Aneurinibacillus sp. Ricciae_BoGa-3]WCK52851.1 tRNA pseudouridine(55) synthase TruB [Aneurinibacillus sp. Ricciae_BoGa-3]